MKLQSIKIFYTSKKVDFESLFFFLVTSFPFIDLHKCGCKFIEQIIQNKIFLLFFMFVLQIIQKKNDSVSCIPISLLNTNYYRHAKISSFKSFREVCYFISSTQKKIIIKK